MRLVPSSIALLSAVLAGVLACGSDPVTPRPLHPLAGTYDVTATMDTVHPRIPCPPPDVGYCHGTEPANGFAGFSGVLTISDTMTSAFPRPLQLRVDATMQTCIGPSLTAGCGSAGASYPAVLEGGVVADSTIAPLELVVMSISSPPTASINVLTLESTFAGDSLSGRAEWAVNGGASYAGHFVAHRRH